MKTFTEALSEICEETSGTAETPAQFSEDAVAIKTASIRALIEEIGADPRMSMWAAMYVHSAPQLQAESITIQDLCTLVVGAFANGVYVGQIMERQEL